MYTENFLAINFFIIFLFCLRLLIDSVYFKEATTNDIMTSIILPTKT